MKEVHCEKRLDKSILKCEIIFFNIYFAKKMFLITCIVLHVQSLFGVLSRHTFHTYLLRAQSF